MKTRRLGLGKSRNQLRQEQIGPTSSRGCEWEPSESVRLINVCFAPIATKFQFVAK